jgi:hypothetical protein
LAQRNAEAAADWWLANDPVGANACAAEMQGTGKYYGIDPAVHGPALVQSFTRAQEYAELGKQVDAFRIQHKLTDSAVRRMAEAINSGVCERSLEAAYDHVMSRTTNPREREEWFRYRNVTYGSPATPIGTVNVRSCRCGARTPLGITLIA